MKNLVAIIGSPNRNGKTATLAKEIIKGAEKSGASIKVFYLNDMDIKYCQGCMYCKKVGEGCCLNDDMQEVYKYLKEADALIVGSPIYAHQVSAQTKTFIDRLFALFDGNFQRKFHVKKTVMVYSQHEANPELYKTYFDINFNLFKGLGLDISDTIVSAEIDHSQKEELAKRAFQIGEKLFG